MPNAAIMVTGHYVPEKVLDNQQFQDRTYYDPGTGQLDFNVSVTAFINGRPGGQRLEMGDAQAMGARYLDAATPPHRRQAAISGSDFFSIGPGLVELKRKPRNSFYLPTTSTLWKWTRGERMPIEVTGMTQCAGPRVSWDCFSSNQNRNVGFDCTLRDFVVGTRP